MRGARTHPSSPDCASRAHTHRRKTETEGQFNVYSLEKNNEESWGGGWRTQWQWCVSRDILLWQLQLREVGCLPLVSLFPLRTMGTPRGEEEEEQEVRSSGAHRLVFRSPYLRVQILRAGAAGARFSIRLLRGGVESNEG